MATIDISGLENLEMDSARSREETEALIQFLRQRQKRATQEDVAFAKNLKSVGQAGIKGLKTRRDFLLARRGNPSITLKDFLLSPEKGAKDMKEGVQRILDEKAPTVSILETLGFDRNRGFSMNTKKYAPTVYGTTEDAVINPLSKSENLTGVLNANTATPEEIAEAVSQAKERLGDVKDTVELAGDVKDTVELAGDISEGVDTLSDSADVLTDASTGASSLTSSALTSLDVAKDIQSFATRGATPKNLLSILGTGTAFLNPALGLGLKVLSSIFGTSKYNR